MKWRIDSIRLVVKIGLNPLHYEHDCTLDLLLWSVT